MTELSRRVVLGAGAGALAALAGCAPANGSGPDQAETRGASPDVNPTPEPTGSGPGAGVLLVFFSRPGENYWEGGRRDLKVGNTKVIADMIAERIECGVHEILAADPYPHAYDPTVRRNQREQDQDARPAIAGEPPDVSGYDTVLIGSPVWNTRAPMIVRTFLDEAGGLAGKTVLPFLTFAVGEGTVFDDYARFCPDARVHQGLAVRGEEAAAAAGPVEAWLRGTGLT